MSSVREIRAQLEALDATLRTARASAEYPGVRLMQAGLQDMRQQMTEALESARAREVDVIIDGAPVVGHEIRIDALAKLLKSLQESVSSVAQALTGKATGSSSIPGQLRDATALSLAGVFDGSFGAKLKGPAPEDDLMNLVEDDEVRTLLDDAVDRVLNVIELASALEPGDDAIVDAVLPLGSRAFKHLSDLSSTIVDEEMTASLAWHTPVSEVRTVRLNRAAALRLDDVLGRNKLTERDQLIEGRLGTVSDIRNRVELQTDDGEIIGARVADDLVSVLGDFYTQLVSATVHVTTMRSQVTGLERNQYVLVGLASPAVPAAAPADDDLFGPGVSAD